MLQFAFLLKRPEVLVGEMSLYTQVNQGLLTVLRVDYMVIVSHNG